MALTARMNLRMQKEVKLLLSDPPPGASFPSLSSDHSSLSSIYAQLEGPEGSVYATGIFDLKIGIPERYPFQPPAVTFLTPIYHPNIDNGGRICLDILNLPPKGAWQPSLNISTVLTSIGLLLSEPNPDDGLMCEASREYKYNRQAFDRKAKAMTEKYAKAGARGHNSGNECMEINLHLRTELEAEVSDKVPKDDVVDAVSCQEKQRKIRKKLSLDFSGSTSKRDNDGEAKDHSQWNPENPMESEGQGKELINMADNYSHIHRRLRGRGGKLSLESSIQSNQKDSHKMSEGPTAERSNSPSNPQSSSMAPGGLSPELPGDSCGKDHQYAHKLVCGYKTAIPGRHGQSSQMKGLESADECHVVENDGQKPVSSIKFSSSPTPSNLSCGPNPNALPVSYDKSESGDDCCSKAGNNATDTMLHKSSFSGKKLSLGLIVQPMQQEKVDKENLRPISVPSTHKQTGIISQLLLPPQDPYTDASKRQLHDQHQNGQIGENQQGQEELLAAESVIVLDSEDSEDSEEESEGPFTSKSLLTRKRAVKRSAYS